MENVDKENQEGETNLQETASKTIDSLKDKHMEESGISPLDEAIVGEKYDNNQLHQRIRKMRKDADSIFRTLKLWGKGFGPGETGRYINLATTSMESSRHFYGKMLREKGAQSPYSKDNALPVIPDQGEALAELPAKTEDACHLLRDKIEEQVVEMVIYVEQVAHLNVLDFIAQNTVIQKLMEAKHWIGEILGVLARENKERNQSAE